jgi:chromosome segregation ATPase
MSSAGEGAKVRGCSRVHVTDPRPPSEQPEPTRKKVRRRRRRAQTGAVFPSVLKVEIQNLEGLGGLAAGSAEQVGPLAADRRRLEEREAALSAAEADVAARGRRLSELEETLGPAAALVESRESLDRRERRVGELERTIRDRARALDERERELDSRRALLEADLELREEDVERREDLLAIREERLEERQRELGVYVSQIQGRLQSRPA